VGALSWIFYFTALKVGPATRVAALDRLSLVFIAILASIFLSEALSVKAIGGIILMVSGVLLLTS
jgi:transporter family protein